MSADDDEIRRLHQDSDRHREQAQRAVSSLEAARDIADAIGSEVELDRVLELIVERGRALVDARSILIMLRQDDELVVAASAGHASGARGHRLPISGSTSGQVLQRGVPQRVVDVNLHMRIAPVELGVPDAQTALIVPMLHHGAGIGVLAAFDRGAHGDSFTLQDEDVLRIFASSAANAVAVKRSVEAGRLRASVIAADSERGRWARELHDQTLQALGALRLLLSTALRRQDEAGYVVAMRQAIDDIELETENLRGIITDLRPSLLDDLGLRPAIESLLERRRENGLTVDGELDLPDAERGAAGLPPELETAVYRVIQEALTNVVKHARARRVRVLVRLSEDELVVEVSDDGVGFETGARTSGFGLDGMRERVFLSGGSFQISSGAGGTTLQARVPVGPASQRASA